MLELTGNPIEPQRDTWDWGEIRAIPLDLSDEKLVSVSYLPEKMVVSPQYFIQQLPGAKADIFVRETIQQKLNDAADMLPCGYKLVIFDAWRDIDTQQSLFDRMQSFVQRDHPEFNADQTLAATLRIVALPSSNANRPSPHNTGGSVDVSIVDKRGRLLEMGSPFDDISARAKTTYYEFEPESEAVIKIRENRRLLYHVMTNAGFTNYLEEWWHYDYGNQNWAFMSGHDTAFYGATKPEFPWL